jgi:hypothetical protein
MVMPIQESKLLESLRIFKKTSLIVHDVALPAAPAIVDLDSLTVRQARDLYIELCAIFGGTK